MAEQFVWRDGARWPADAQEVGERLSALREANRGCITPRLVVDDARPEGSPLHDCFNWDDAQAAELHRAETARSLIRSVRVVVRDEGRAERPVLQYVHVRLPDEGPAYVTTVRALSDAELREQVMADALDGLRSWQRRYEHIAELGPLFEGIDRLLARAQRAGRRKARPKKAARAAAGNRP